MWSVQFKHIVEKEGKPEHTKTEIYNEIKIWLRNIQFCVCECLIYVIFCYFHFAIFFSELYVISILGITLYMIDDTQKANFQKTTKNDSKVILQKATQMLYDSKNAKITAFWNFGKDQRYSCYGNTTNSNRSNEIAY